MREIGIDLFIAVWVDTRSRLARVVSMMAVVSSTREIRIMLVVMRTNPRPWFVRTMVVVAVTRNQGYKRGQQQGSRDDETREAVHGTAQDREEQGDCRVEEQSR